MKNIVITGVIAGLFLLVQNVGFAQTDEKAGVQDVKKQKTTYKVAKISKSIDELTYKREHPSTTTTDYVVDEKGNVIKKEKKLEKVTVVNQGDGDKAKKGGNIIVEKQLKDAQE